MPLHALLQPVAEPREAAEHELLETLAQHDARHLAVGVERAELAHADADARRHVPELRRLHAAVRRLPARPAAEARALLDVALPEVELEAELGREEARPLLLLQDLHGDGAGAVALVVALLQEQQLAERRLLELRFGFVEMSFLVLGIVIYLMLLLC